MPGPAPLTATGRKYGSDWDTTSTGDDILHNNVPWCVILVGRHKYIRTLIADPEERYDLGVDPEELDNLAVRPEFRERPLHMRELKINHSAIMRVGLDLPVLRL